MTQTCALIHSWLAPVGLCSTKQTSVSRVDDSETRQLLHSGTGYWISGPAG